MKSTGPSLFKSTRPSEKPGNTKTVAERLSVAARPAPPGMKIRSPRKLSDGMGAKK